VGKSEGKELIRRPGLGLENNVEINRRETGLKVMDWV
jgi:hypothetical protein